MQVILRLLVSLTFGTVSVLHAQDTTHYMREVTSVLAPDFAGQVAVVESDRIQGWAHYSGRIEVTRGMLHFMANEAELACLLAHELGHLKLQHYEGAVARRGLKGKLLDGLMDAAAKTMRQKLGEVVGDRLSSKLAEYAERVKENGWSRKREEEADLYALTLVQQVGYDVRACSQLYDGLALMAGLQGSSRRGGSHKSLRERADALESRIREQQIDLSQSGATSKRGSAEFRRRAGARTRPDGGINFMSEKLYLDRSWEELIGEMSPEGQQLLREIQEQVEAGDAIARAIALGFVASTVSSPTAPGPELGELLRESISSVPSTFRLRARDKVILHIALHENTFSQDEKRFWNEALVALEEK